MNLLGMTERAAATRRLVVGQSRLPFQIERESLILRKPSLPKVAGMGSASNMDQAGSDSVLSPERSAKTGLGGPGIRTRNLPRMTNLCGAVIGNLRRNSYLVPKYSKALRSTELTNSGMSATEWIPSRYSFNLATGEKTSKARVGCFAL